MTIYNLNFSDQNGLRPNPAGWNEITATAAATTGALLNSVGGDDGVTYEILTSYTGASGSTSWADSDLYGFPANVWRNTFYAGTGLGRTKVSGLQAGDNYTISAIGHANNAARDTDFTVEGVTLRYDNTADSASRVAPVVFTGTVPVGGELIIDQEIVSSFSYINGAILEVTTPVTGPTITGPDTTTEGAATVQTGTLQDTVVTQSLISGSYSIEQTIDSATATTLNYVAESGVNLCTPSVPVSGVPLEPTITAAGITPYVVQQEADDGTNPPATRNITLNPEATHEVIQTMAGVANTIPDQSIFGTNIIVVEDDMQAYVPKTANGMTITWASDGTFTTGMVDQTEVIDVAFFSPATGQWSCIELTIQNSSIVSSRSSFDFPNFQFPILDTTH